MSRFASAPWPLKAAYVLTLGGCAATMALGLAALIALAGLHQLSVHTDLVRAPAWFWYFRADSQVRHWLAIGLMSAHGLLLVTVVAVARGLKPPLHGAARWATEAEIAQAGLRSHQGILLGRAGGRLLVFGGAEHVMLHAPTRSGKGVGVVIPNLLSWPDSVVVLDIKRENWTASAGFRAAHGQRVMLFDPLDPDGRTARFNPLGHIDRHDPSLVVDELQKLAVMLFPTLPNADPFWAEAARTGLIGVGAYVAQTPDLTFSLGAIYHELTAGDGRTRWPAVIAARHAAGAPLSAGCVSALTDFASGSENTFASVRQTITARMNLWLNPRVCAATDASDFDLRALRSQRISLYLATSPDNLPRVAPLYNLLFQQLVDLNTRELPAGDRHKIQVLLVLDEFARLGHASVLAHAFSYVAGYGLRLLPVLQSPAQLRAEYGPDLAEEILANCGVEIAFAPKDQKLARELSERLGDWTYPGRTSSRPTLFSTGRRSVSESDQRRALMLPQELLQMPAERLIVMRTGLPPIQGRKLVHWRDAAFRARLRLPPTVASYALARTTASPAASHATVAAACEPDFLRLADADLEALPPEGASEAEIEAWVNRYIDAAVRVADPEPDHVE